MRLGVVVPAAPTPCHPRDLGGGARGRVGCCGDGREGRKGYGFWTGVHDVLQKTAVHLIF